MSEELWMTCENDPKWAAGRIEQLEESERVLIDRVHAAECDIMPHAPKPIETAPKDADGILVYSPSFYQNKGGWVAAVWHRDGWHSNPGGWRFEPTHWLPFPDAPPRPKGE